MDEALRFVEKIAGKVREQPLPWGPRWLLGVDVAYGPKRGWAGVAAFDVEKAKVVDGWVTCGVTPWPYLPGFFFLREAPLVLSALAQVPTHAVVLVHGHGRAHPLGAGLASVVGVLLGRPTVGCAGSLLCGHGSEPGEAKGSWSPVWWQGKPVGAFLRTRAGVKPVVVSVGHGLSLEEALGLVQAASFYRFPEPLRLADRLARKALSAATGA